MREILKCLKFLQDRGVDFYLEGEDGGGTIQMLVGARGVVEYLQDKNRFYAEYHGVSVDDFIAWRSEGCSVRCSALTKNGRRCKNYATGMVDVSAKEWVKNKGEYCQVHSAQRERG